MKAFSKILVLVLAVCLAGAALAADDAKPVTLTGKVVCAMCILTKSDAKDCQNVLLVDKNGATEEYYLVKNPVAEKYGHACKNERAAVVTGKLTKKDGKTWLEPTKMDEPKL